jgi:hypothetical protein
MRYWIFDAGRLPFVSNSISGVIGNSVLHHLLHYENTISDVFRVLRLGGLAVFGEPVMDAHAITAFLLGVIIHLEKRYAKGGYSEKALETMYTISRQQAFMGKSKRENRGALAPFEDKHALGVQETLDLGYKIGFSKVVYVNSFTAAEIGSSHKHQLGGLLRLWGVDDTKLAPYDFLFQEFTDAYGMAIGPSAPVNYGYFKFLK